MSFKTALSGLNAAQTDLNVIGNNIANVSTSGFKKSRAEFVDVYAASYQGISRLTVGSGVRVAQVQQNMSQGLTEYTDNNLDLAIQGRGFFVIKDTDGTQLFSRAGAFAPDRDGYVTNSRGQRLQVFPPNTDGTFNTGLTQDLRLSTDEGPPSATTDVEIGVQLDADAVTPAIAFDPSAPTSYNYATSVTIYDSLGSTHLQTMYYVKTGTNAWDVYSTLTDSVDDSDGVVGTDGAAGRAGTGDSFAEPAVNLFAGQEAVVQGPVSLAFSPNGTLNTINALPPTDVTYEWTIDNGAQGNDAQPIAGNFAYTMDFLSSTQYSKDSGVNALVQDGYPSGLLTGVDVDDTGVVFANYTNGLAEPLGKIGLATFQNPQGLQPSGDSTWAETFGSGDVLIGEPGSANLGLIQGGALESSNVNLSEELVSLIVAQRNFQASAQAITTENTITQAIINIR